MTYTLDLPPHLEAYLREKAEREGETPEALAVRLIAYELAREAQDLEDSSDDRADHQP
jgi:hypothetical protein